MAYEKDPIGTAAQHVYDIVNAEVDDLFHNSVRHAVGVIEEALDKYRWVDGHLCMLWGRV